MPDSQDCFKRVKQRWGKGWSLLSPYQREGEVAREILFVLLAQDEETAPPGSAYARFKQFAQETLHLANPEDHADD